MIGAIESKKPFSLDNTQVVISEDKSYCDVFLHGNHIIKILYGYGVLEGQYCNIVNLETLCSYPTNTTKSRLRALDINVYHKKGRLFLDDKELNRE